MNYNILVSGVGGPTPRSILKRLRKITPQSKLIGIDSNSKAIGFYMESLLDYSYVIPKAGDKDYWETIIDIVKKHKIDFAFIQPEKEVMEWGRYFVKNKKFPCSVLLPPIEYSELLVNKAKMAEVLKDTKYIPATINISQSDPLFDEIEKKIGYPFWIRASTGSGGLGSLKIQRKEELKAWLFIHKDINEFTVSEYLPGRHLANQMMYINGKCVRNAGIECVEYVMADVAPSKVTGNTSFGRFINEKKLLDFCEETMEYISEKINVNPHGVYSFDLKEDVNGNLKVTEINVRHMAYTGIMAEVGFDLIKETLDYLTGNFDLKKVMQHQYFFKYDYIFLRDVDISPIIMKESDLLSY